MARMPEAEWVGPHHDNGVMVRYDIVCIHTIAGNPPAHAAHFSTRSDGHKYQSRDTVFQSAANYQGNPRVIAIENDDTGSPFPNWDHNDPHQVPAFTAEQIEANAFICAWAHQVHGIPLEQCPDSRPGSRGIAYHRQGIDGNFYSAGYSYAGRLPGGEVWTLSPGKACPGDRRIAQIPQIIKRARQIAGLDPNPVEEFLNEEDDMIVLMKGDLNNSVYAVKIDPTLQTANGEATSAVRCYIPGPIGAALIAAYGNKVVTVPQASFDAIAKVEGSA
jgi:hypothetical protein